jgi:zinc transport system ATP-binding protein
LEAIAKLANRVACMNRQLFFHGQKEEFFSNKDLLKTYTESAMQMHMHHH